MTYEQPEAGGSWEHRSGDCPKHGGNIVFAKPYRSKERYTCVQCMLEAASRLASGSVVQGWLARNVGRK
jgi:hypothetical protein